MSAWRIAQRAISSCAAAFLLSFQAVAQAETQTAPGVEPLVAEVQVNGQRMAEPIVLLKDDAGRLYASETLVRAWRLSLPSSGSLRFEGENYRRIDGISSLNLEFSSTDQSLSIDAAPGLFQSQNFMFDPIGPMETTPSATGAFLNYDLFVERTGGRMSLNGLGELHLFTPKGTGVSNFAVRYGDDARKLLRLETSWTIDRPEKLSSIRFGDTITRGGYGTTPVRIAGIQFARNFAVQPGFVTLPLPTLTGSAALPSTAEIYVNNVLQGTREVQPGPFELGSAPVQTGGGTVQLITTDVLGRQVITSHRYYSSTQMLRKGLHDFSYEVGFLRKDLGVKSNQYGAMTASATHRYGVTDQLTAEANVQLTKSIHTGGIMLTTTLFDLALFTVSGAGSRSNLGSGGALAFGVERRGRGVSVGGHAEWRSQRYTRLEETEARRTRFTATAFADYSFRGGSIGVNYFRRDNRLGDNEELVGGLASFAVRGGTLQIAARRAVTGRSNTVIGASFALPFGRRGNASVSVDVENGRRIARTSVQQNLPAGPGGGYRAVMESGAIDRFQAQYVWQGTAGTWGVETAKVGKSAGVRISAAGSVGIIGGRAFVSRRLDSSFADVRVDKYPRVRVYADNHLVGVTDSKGRLIVPNLRAYEANPIRIDDADLPIDAHLPAYESVVRPYAGSGVIVRFNPRRERGVVMQVRLQDGAMLPAGAEVRVDGRSEVHNVATGGELYIEGLAGVTRLTAAWRGRSCRFVAAVPDNDDPQPRLEGLICSEDRHAAR